MTATATPKTPDLVELDQEFRGGWNYEMLWNPETNEITIRVTGKLEKTLAGNRQTAVFTPPAAEVSAAWKTPFHYREYLTEWIEHPAGH